MFILCGDELLLKTSSAHPDALLNYLVNCDIADRELFFLSASLNRLDNMIIHDNIDNNFLSNFRNSMADILYLLIPAEIKIGERGFIKIFVDECQWDIDEFIEHRKKEYGKS